MVVVAISILFAMAGVYVIVAFSFIYGAQVIGWSEATRTQMFIVVQITALLGALLFGALQDRLGGRTTGYDVRPEVADQVRSVGAQWLNIGIDAAGEGGYARELTEEERAAQQKKLEEAIVAWANSS